MASLQKYILTQRPENTVKKKRIRPKRLEKIVS